MTALDDPTNNGRTAHVYAASKTISMKQIVKLTLDLHLSLSTSNIPPLLRSLNTCVSIMFHFNWLITSPFRLTGAVKSYTKVTIFLDYFT